jgi:hypothetical protein
MAAQQKWSLSGDYFENCKCNIVCPFLVSPSAPLTARPSQGVCDVALVFHRHARDGAAFLSRDGDSFL